MNWIPFAIKAATVIPLAFKAIALVASTVKAVEMLFRPTENGETQRGKEKHARVIATISARWDKLRPSWIDAPVWAEILNSLIRIIVTWWNCRHGGDWITEVA